MQKIFRIAEVSTKITGKYLFYSPCRGDLGLRG